MALLHVSTLHHSFLCELYMFSHDDAFTNLSCIDPHLLSTRQVSSMSNNVGLVFANCSLNDSHYVMCISVIYVTDCSLHSPRQYFTIDGPGLWVINADFLVQEFERLLGCLGVVYKTLLFGFDLFTSHIQFWTYMERHPESKTDNGKFMFTHALLATMHFFLS